MAWLTGYSYRKSHLIIASAGAGTGFQVKITVHYGTGTSTGDNVYCSSLCKTDFGDIRFTDNDGTTELSYWMQSKVDSDNAIFWVKVNDTLESNATIYMYYGKSDASTTSNLVNTMVGVIDDTKPTELALPMDENTGLTTYDRSGNNNDATFQGGTKPTWEAGKYTYGIKSAGVGYMTIPDAASLQMGMSNFSIFCWVKVDTFTNQAPIIIKTSYPNAYYFLDMDDDLSPYCEIWDGSHGKGYKVANSTPNTGVWYLVGFTVNRSTNELKLYVNGAQVGTTQSIATTTGNISPTATAILFSGHSTILQGTICDLRIIRRVLTDAEILAIYNNYAFEV